MNPSEGPTPTLLTGTASSSHQTPAPAALYSNTYYQAAPQSMELQLQRARARAHTLFKENSCSKNI